MDNVSLLKLGLTQNEKNLYDKNKVEYNKRVGNMLKASRANAKNSQCLICGKDCSSFCNSHSVPQFCLQNIAEEGKFYHSGNLVDMPMVDKEKGIGEAGTFKIICRECDSSAFSDYENPEAYYQEPTDKMLSQIAMKNYLKSISKRQLEIQIYRNMTKEFGELQMLSQMEGVGSLDLEEYVDEFSYAKKACQSKWDNNYYLSYFHSVPYVVPIAFQNNIALVSDLEGGTINDIYNPLSEYVIKNIQICVFPLKTHSIIMMFCRNGENRYSKFFKQFRKLSTEEKLKVINYIIFLYSEDYYFYKGINQEIIGNENLKDVAKTIPVSIADSPFADSLTAAKEYYDLNKRDSIPNFLSEAFKVI
ncbi:hypothetical protein SAMN05720606_101115 [Paenibacillus polysaccharolyticus]|uniref:HNH endonuclease n=1 Tax=Paenibacillus polysaccharolyticus TaxID=582692 RepID=A0A1G5AV12_9BACL|nr:hypothetical protein [Paenibacillus polysaccharolyticus]SCX81696.1 hypothetical protein SAMN05720606_101115 [Paenibacillus polysaccharolyticus]